MRKFVLAAAAVATLMATVPASAADFFYSNDPAAGNGSEAAAEPGFGANRGIEFGYVPIQESRDQAVTPRGHAANKAVHKNAPKSTGSAYDY
jgi:hypothetical protein